MKTLIKKIIKNKEYKPLVENFASLSGLQIASYILPLITLPYLVRVLGPEKYGLIAFATAFVTYFQILTDYGFNLSATREISIHRENKEKISEIFSSVMIIKTLLAVLSIIILSIIIFSFSQFRNDWLIYYLTFGIVIGNLLFPTWFFQGIEKMKYITVLNILSQVIFTISIFIIIKNSSDYFYVPLINSLGFILAGSLGLLVAFKEFNMELKLPNLKAIKFQLNEGWHVFVSTASISLYTTSNTFVLGLFTTNTIVGYYSAAEKIILAAVGILNPISQTVYPYIGKIANESKEKGINIVKKMTLIIGSIGLFLTLILFIFANLIVVILFGIQYQESTSIMRILAFLPLIVGLSNVLGVLFLFAFGYSNRVSRVQLRVGICYLLLVVPMTYFLKDIGTALSLLLVETIITILFWKIYRNVINELKIC